MAEFKLNPKSASDFLDLSDASWSNGAALSIAHMWKIQAKNPDTPSSAPKNQSNVNVSNTLSQTKSAKLITALLKPKPTSRSTTKVATLKKKSIKVKSKPQKLGPTKVPFDPNLPLMYPVVWNTRPKECAKRSRRNILVILVHTARGNFLERETIRKTWGSVKSYKSWDVKLVFIIGEKSPQEELNIKNKLGQEYKKFGDISKSTFVDSYKNLTLKHAAGYAWVLTNCPNATLVLKTDDDFVIDIFKVINNKLGKRVYYEDQGALWCRVYRKKSPIRSVSSKWFVPTSLYSHKKYPDFCSGGSYLTTVPTMRQMLNASKSVQLIPMDDVFFTGIAVQKANREAALISANKKPSVKLIDIARQYIYYHWSSKGMNVTREWYRNHKTKSSPWTFFLVQHTNTFFTDFNQIWKKICFLNSWKTNQIKHTQTSNVTLTKPRVERLKSTTLSSFS